jgi:pyridoxal phosphate enzyme (YggS family)
MSIDNSLKAVQEIINNAASKSGRNPADIKLVTVSKTIELERIIEAVKAGATILGENRIQEAKEKITNYDPACREAGLRTCLPIGKVTNFKPEWHLIGNLQKNKARHAVQLFDLIHSVNDIALAEELNRQAHKINKIQSILVQVKLSDEVTKHGILEENLMELLDKVSGMNNLKLEGFMTMPPFFEDIEKTRPYFRKLKEISGKAIKNGYPINELSMGMSNDFPVAIEEGSTMVRVGTAIFGKRSY